MSDDDTDRPGLTWIATAALLLPTMVVQLFCRMLLLPKLDAMWEAVAPRFANTNAATLHELVHHLLGHFWLTAGGMLFIILTVEFAIRPSRRIRSMIAAMLAVIYNTSILIGIVAMAVTFAVTASPPSASGTPNEESPPPSPPPAAVSPASPGA